MEIERKFLTDLPADLDKWPSTEIEQAYLCDDPVVRVRRDGENYYLTYKSQGLLAREEYNLPLTEAAYGHLVEKADFPPITKTRYRIPASQVILGSERALTIELDVFHGAFAPLVMAEVEFSSEEEAKAYVPAPWFGREVTEHPRFHNSVLSQNGLPDDIWR